MASQGIPIKVVVKHGDVEKRRNSTKTFENVDNSFGEGNTMIDVQVSGASFSNQYQ